MKCGWRDYARDIGAALLFGVAVSALFLIFAWLLLP